jgi:pyridoxal phosphate enzyme (YggS family)
LGNHRQRNQPAGQGALTDRWDQTIEQSRDRLARAFASASPRRRCASAAPPAASAARRQQGAAGGKIAAAFAAGQTAFGESYAQEALEKQAELRDLPVHWHFIGRIQSNKTRDIAAGFDWVHSVCELKHARRLGSQRPQDRRPLKLCVQVNLSGEASKAGTGAGASRTFIAACEGDRRGRREGLMTLPAPSDDIDAQRRPFAALRELRDRPGTPGLPLPTLSMGMSATLKPPLPRALQ